MPWWHWVVGAIEFPFAAYGTDCLLVPRERKPVKSLRQLLAEETQRGKPPLDFDAHPGSVHAVHVPSTGTYLASSFLPREVHDAAVQAVVDFGGPHNLLSS
jgi:hypothetical protein